MSRTKDWMKQHVTDPYVKKAKFESYRARSAFKLIEMDKQNRLMAAGDVVVDCGCAPGSWTQVAVRKTNADGKDLKKAKGLVIGVDLLDCEPVEGATVLGHSDITKEIVQQKIKAALDGRQADLVMSDMAPNVSGIKSLDRENCLDLVYASLKFSLETLKPGGAFLVKIFSGQHGTQLDNDLKTFFNDIKRIKPAASRSNSSEFYYLAKNFKGIVK